MSELDIRAVAGVDGVRAQSTDPVDKVPRLVQRVDGEVVHVGEGVRGHLPALPAEEFPLYVLPPQTRRGRRPQLGTAAGVRGNREYYQVRV